MDLTNKTYIVSGAATSLGREVAVELAENNANLILAGIEYGELEEVEETYDSLNGIILVHSIFTDDKTVYNVSFNEFSETMYEHVWGTYLGIRTLRPLLKNEDDAKIINVIEPSFEEVFERNLYYTV